MKTLEKKVHFVAEGEIVGCYDSKGNPMQYLLTDGTPYIKLDSSDDRVCDIDNVLATNTQPIYFGRNRRDSLAGIHVRGIINGYFISANNSIYKYAARACSQRELASFHLAMYKAYNNAIKLEVKNG